MRIGEKRKKVRNPKRIVKPIKVDIPKKEEQGIPVEIPLGVPVERPKEGNTSGNNWPPGI